MAKEIKTNEELLTEGFLTNLLNKPLRSHSDREKMESKKADMERKLNYKMGMDEPYSPERREPKKGFESVIKPGYEKGPATVITDTAEASKRLTQFLGQGVAANSIKAQASKSIKRFPIIMSELIDDESAILIKKKAEEEYAEVLALVISNKIIDSSAFNLTDPGEANIALRVMDDIHTDYNLTSTGRAKTLANKAASTGKINPSDIGKYDITYSLVAESASNADKIKLDDRNFARLVEDAVIVPEGSAPSIINYLNEHMEEIIEEADYIVESNNEIDQVLSTLTEDRFSAYGKASSEVIDKMLRASDFDDVKDKQKVRAAFNLMMTGKINFDSFMNYLATRFPWMSVSESDIRDLRNAYLSSVGVDKASSTYFKQPGFWTKLFNKSKANRMTRYQSYGLETSYISPIEIDELIDADFSERSYEEIDRDRRIKNRERDDAAVNAANRIWNSNLRTISAMHESENIDEGLFSNKKLKAITVKDVDYSKNLMTTPSYQTRSSKAFGSATIDRRYAKDRKYYQPLTMEVKFKERLSDGTYTDNELSAVIGIFGNIIRIPSNEMVELLKINAEGANHSDILPSLNLMDIKKTITNSIYNLFSGRSFKELEEIRKKMPTSAEVFQNLEKMSSLAMANAAGGRGGKFLANAHLVFDMKEIDECTTETGYNYLTNSKLCVNLMKKFSLYSLMICNGITERLGEFDDIDGTGWNWVGLASIKNSDGTENLAGNLRDLLKNKGAY